MNVASWSSSKADQWEGVPVLHSNVVQPPVIYAWLQGLVLLLHEKETGAGRQ